MAARLIFVHALSSLHAGTGQGVGAIDLPIARERATKLPLVPGSSIKGCLREACKATVDAEKVFGKQDEAGLVQVADARLLLLPVRCLGATFMWTTSPYVLRRLARDLQAAGIAEPAPVPDVPDETARVASGDALVLVGNEKKLVLEDLDFTAAVIDPEPWADWLAKSLFAGETAWQAEFKKRFAIIDDKSFCFLAEFATEVSAHIKIDPLTGTVDKEHGALWYQEALPAETVLVSLVRLEERNGDGEKGKAWLSTVTATRSLQLGGKATTGQGVVRLVPVGGA